MRADLRAHNIASARDDVEHACRKSRLMQRFGDDARLHRAHFARFDDRRATRRERRRQLAADKAGVAIPRRDQPGNAERLHHYFCRTRVTHERIVFEHLRRFQQHVARVSRHPAPARNRCAVFFDDGLEKLILFRDDGGVHALQHVDSFALVRPRECGKCALRRRNRLARIVLVCEAHAADNFFCRGIEEFEKLVAVRRDKRAADINLVDVMHDEFARSMY